MENIPRFTRRNKQRPSEALPPGTLWIILGANALISTIISLLVVLIVGPWVFTGTLNSFITPEAAQTDNRTAQPLSSGGEALQPPATFTPTPQPQSYLVQVGDTLSLIAEQFGISQEVLMAANNLPNPDYLQVGQTLFIPAGNAVAASPAETPPPPTETALPFEPPGAANNTVTPIADISPTDTPTLTPIPSATAPPLDEVTIEINSALGYGQLADEVITLSNLGPGVKLYGWQLTGSALGNYQFPNLFLWNGGSVRLHTTAGTNTPTDLYWGQPEAAWFSGDTIILKNPDGKVMAEYTIP